MFMVVPSLLRQVTRLKLSDSANLDAVVAHTRGDETVREAVSVFIDHAGTLIEQGGPMVLLCAPPKDLLAAVYNRTIAHRSSTNQKCKTTQKEDPMTQKSATQRGSEQADAIRPFHVNVPEAELTELRRRINATKWPERETVADASQGVQ